MNKAKSYVNNRKVWISMYFFLSLLWLIVVTEVNYSSNYFYSKEPLLIGQERQASVYLKYKHVYTLWLYNIN